jgi:hypothetical protein
MLARVRRTAARSWRSVSYGAQRLAHRPFLPPLDAAASTIVARLESEGTVVTSLAELGMPELLASARRFFAEMPRIQREGRKSYMLAAPPRLVEAHPDLIDWGLDERIMALVENYLGLPVSYRGVQARIDLADGTQVETRLWHRDGEDRRILKFIVYAADVPPGEGGFEFIAKPDAPPERSVRLTNQRVLDADMARLVPVERWRPCTGLAGTVVVTDTCSVWHRGGVPGGRDRMTLFYAYNSRRPLAPEHCTPLFDRARFAADRAGRLTPAQLAAIAG